MMRAFSAFLALCAACAPAPRAEAQNAAEAMAPLLGCWRGAFEGNPSIRDERCFETLGEHVVDVHRVSPGDYAGETTYHLDDANLVIIWAYAANDGGRSNGQIRRTETGFSIPAFTHYDASGAAYRLRSIWTLEGPDRLVMESEREVEGAWRPYMRIVFTRM